ncbi:MAG: tyrosine--tRNA ligase [Actinomycetota bacterium]
MRPLEEQRRVLKSNVAQVIPEDEFDRRLDESASSGRPLRVKLGVDPTAGELTLGWTVVLRKLRQFQDMGHQAVLIVGDFTAQVGDPSGRSETRRALSAEEVRANVDAVLEQFDAVLDTSELEIRHNSEWLATMGMAEVLRMTSHYTVARMLERDDFANRMSSGTPISIMEFLYPLLQGYDSVAVEADVELGGTDQTFNNLVGRVLQERYGHRPQVVVTMPLLVGTDGERAMGQSLGNYIGIREPADEIFGKIMSLPDHVTVDYFRLVTDLPSHQVEQISEGLASGHLHPAEAKRRLGWEVVRMYRDEEAADEARERFDRIHRERDLPEEVQEAEIPADLIEGGRVWLPRLLATLGLAGSSSEGRRLIAQGGVKVDGRTETQEEVDADGLRTKVVQVGRRKFLRLL